LNLFCFGGLCFYLPVNTECEAFQTMVRRKALEEGAKGTKSLATMWARPAAVAKRRSSDGAAAPTAAKVAKVASGQPTIGATPDQGAPQSKPVGKKNRLRLRRSRWGKSAEDVAREKRAQAEEEEEVEQLEDVAATTESDAGDGPAEPGASSDSE
jgi:plasmid stability protein